ncbi:MAG TPA: hypothetical protein VFL97_08825 [Nitrococcus sp.]|nr:hypothetical protein [Nitrococcus sp.]
MCRARVVLGGLIAAGEISDLGGYYRRQRVANDDHAQAIIQGRTEYVGVVAGMEGGLRGERPVAAGSEQVKSKHDPECQRLERADRLHGLLPVEDRVEA